VNVPQELQPNMGDSEEMFMVNHPVVFRSEVGNTRESGVFAVGRHDGRRKENYA
jgi:hypothetical protein